MQWILDTLLGHRGFNDWYTMSFYFIPVGLNIIGGIFMFVDRLRDDLKAREKIIKELAEDKPHNDRVYDYHKYLTLGEALWYVFIGVCPVCAIWNCLFESFPYLAHRLGLRFDWLFKLRFISEPKSRNITEV